MSRRSRAGGCGGGEGLRAPWRGHGVWRGRAGTRGTRGVSGGCCWDVRSDCGGGGGGAGEGPGAGGGYGWREEVDTAGGAGEKSVCPAVQPVRNAESRQEICRAGE